jgi:hypothetical protein
MIRRGLVLGTNWTSPRPSCGSLPPEDWSLTGRDPQVIRRLDIVVANVVSQEQEKRHASVSSAR